MTDTQRVPELKPCPNPWCNSSKPPTRVLSQCHMEVGHAIRCACGVIGPQESTSKKAIAAWNRRTETERENLLMEALEGFMANWHWIPEIGAFLNNQARAAIAMVKGE